MAKPLSVRPVYDALRQYERSRPDLGFGKGLLDGVLEPASPFDHKGTRSPKRWFVWLAMLAASIVGCFIYFNSVR
jgi:hypothetical protein